VVDASYRQLKPYTLLIISLFLFTTVGICGCNQAKAPKKATPAIGFRFSSSRPPLAEEDPGTRLVYKLPANGVFHGTYEIENGISLPQDYRVCAFLDYQPVAIAINGKKYVERTERLAKNQKKWVEFSIGPIPKGSHDLVMVIFWNLKNHSAKDDFRLETGFRFVLSCRANVYYSENSVKPVVEIRPPLGSQNTNDGSGNPKPGANIEGVLVNRAASDYSVWTKESVKPGQELKYYIHLGNNTAVPRTYAIMPFLDFRPIPVSHSDTEPFYVTVPPYSVSTYAANIEVPPAQGVHELIVLAGASPYVDLNDSNFPDSIIRQSVRVLLDVKSK
jgi:hypothetical protein